MLELLSSTITKKLRGNSSMFSRMINRKYGLTYSDYDSTKRFIHLVGNATGVQAQSQGFFPYYTNGGGQDSYYNMLNITCSERTAACTVKTANKNIIVKTIFTGLHEYGMTRELLCEVEYQATMEQFYEAEYEKLKKVPASCVITEVEVSFPTPGFASCPLQYIAIFCGLTEDEAQTEIYLNNATSVEHVVEVARLQHWRIQEVCSSNYFYHYVVFKQENSRTTSPLIWIGFTEAAYDRNKKFTFDKKLSVNLGSNVFICKYMKLLLIDAYRLNDDNIDVDSVIVRGYPVDIETGKPVDQPKVEKEDFETQPRFIKFAPNPFEPDYTSSSSGSIEYGNQDMPDDNENGPPEPLLPLNPTQPEPQPKKKCVLF